MRDMLKKYMETEILAARSEFFLMDEPKPKCPHIPRCFENSDGCWNYDEAKKRVDAYPNFP